MGDGNPKAVSGMAGRSRLHKSVRVCVVICVVVLPTLVTLWAYVCLRTFEHAMVQGAKEIAIEVSVTTGDPEEILGGKVQLLQNLPVSRNRYEKICVEETELDASGFARISHTFGWAGDPSKEYMVLSGIEDYYLRVETRGGREVCVPLGEVCLAAAGRVSRESPTLVIEIDLDGQ